ncbi:MAG: hypothetical protein HYZ14_16975 [Bacteroidetes bacterium]|nr:hypothetical protein [Bacteroidota bacterium]
MRFFYLFFISVIFLCCKGQAVVKLVRNPRMFGPFASDLTVHQKYIPPPATIDLGRTSLHPGELVVRDTFNASTVLLQLFPGNFSRQPDAYEKDSLNLIWWTCKDCDTITYEYAWWASSEFSETYPFPDSSWNTTQLLGEVAFKLGKKDYRGLVFFHSNQTIPEFCGRFLGAPTGIALFRKCGPDYVLENFSPLLGSYGSFSQPIYPEFSIAGSERLLIDFTTYNGGPGSEYTEVKELFIPYKNGFKKVLREEFLSCVNTPRGNWRTTLHVVDSTDTLGYSDLVLETSGDFHGRYFYGDNDYGWLFDGAPGVFANKARKAIADSTSFSFTLKRHYAFISNSYKLTQSSMNSKRIRPPKGPYQAAWVLE